jgi:hypothetical protein
MAFPSFWFSQMPSNDIFVIETHAPLCTCALVGGVALLIAVAG